MNNIDNNPLQEYSGIYAIEIAILQQDIELPELPLEPLCLGTLMSYCAEGKVYTLAEQVYNNMVGNFYIPSLFPLVENGESTEMIFDPPDTSNILNETLLSVEYVERNYIQLVIPKYIVLNFRKVIPAGTKFLVGFIGGKTSIDMISIIGLYGQELSLEPQIAEEDWNMEPTEATCENFVLVKGEGDE